jgi:hypothetical protein
MIETTTTPPPGSRLPKAGHDLSLWTAFLGAPVLWLLHLQTAYTLVQYCCSHHTKMPLYISSAIYLILTLAGGYPAFHEFRAAGGIPVATSIPTADPPLGRTRLLATVGLMSTALFFLAIFAQALASFFLNPCAN